mgnify:FL=1
MIDRLLAARVPIMLVMVKLQETGSTLPLTLSEEEWKALKDLSGILSSAKEVLTLLQNQTVPTIGIVYPIIQGLIQTFHEYTPSSLGTTSEFQVMIGVFQQTVVSHIKSRFELVIDSWGEELTLSAFLDPRAKDFFFISDETQR